MFVTAGSTKSAYGCAVCEAPVESEPTVCSSQCRAEADLELRRNRARIRELRRGLHVAPAEGRELRGIYDRNAELLHALLEWVPPLPS